jgi:hypothetical protein
LRAVVRELGEVAGATSVVRAAVVGVPWDPGRRVVAGEVGRTAVEIEAGWSGREAVAA